MRNPARQLADMFERWSSDSPQTPVVDARGLKEDRALSSVREAFSLIGEIESRLKLMESAGHDVAVFMDALAAWTRYVVAFPEGWNAKVNSSNRASRKDMLEALAVMWGPPAPSPSEASVEEARSLVSDVKELAGEDASIPSNLRAYVDTLTVQIEAAIARWEKDGHFDRQQAVEALWIALGAAASHSTDDGFKGRWVALRDRLFVPAGAGMLGSSPALGLQVLQLTTGL